MSEVTGDWSPTYNTLITNIQTIFYKFGIHNVVKSTMYNPTVSPNKNDIIIVFSRASIDTLNKALNLSIKTPVTPKIRAYYAQRKL